MTAIYRLLRLRTKVAMMLSVVFVIVAVMSYTAVILIRPYNCGIKLGRGYIAIGLFNESTIQRPAFFAFMPPPGSRWRKMPIMRINPRPLGVTEYRFEILMPMWCIAPFILLPTFLLWRKDRRIPDGHCQNCGYNLTGNISGKCSECGQPISVADTKLIDQHIE